MLRTTVERADSGVASPRAMELLRKRYQKRFASFDESETSEIDPNEIIPSEAVLRKPETCVDLLVFDLVPEGVVRCWREFIRLSDRKDSIPVAQIALY